MLRIDVLGGLRVVLDGRLIELGGRHRELLGRLVAARGRRVGRAQLIADLWGTAPPAGAGGALATFVGELRSKLEPERAPREPPRVLRTESGGYALHLDESATDAGRLRAALRAAGQSRAGLLAEAVQGWHGVPYADLPDRDWVLAERRELGELHARAVEVHAQWLLDAGRAGEAVPLLDGYTAEYPWRERGWALLAASLDRDGRRHDALVALRGARRMLAAELGLDPSPALAELERDILRGIPAVPPNAEPAVPAAPGPGRLRSTVDHARVLAVSGGQGLATAQRRRLAAAVAAEATGDALLTARIVSAYDVPAIWTRSDDPQASGRLVALIQRTLPRIAGSSPAIRSRLLAALAVEHRGSRDPWALDAAVEAERLARELGDPGLLTFALDGRFMQSFQVPGAELERDRLGREQLRLATRHELPAFVVLGHLVRMQALAGLNQWGLADEQAAAADRAARDFEAPAVAVLTSWYRAMRTAQTGSAGEAVRAYRAADALLGTSMPGLGDGLLPLALLTVRLRHGAAPDPDADYGRYEPWVRPMLAGGPLPGPPADHMHDLLAALAGAEGPDGVHEVGATSGLVSLPRPR